MITERYVNKVISTAEQLDPLRLQSNRLDGNHLVHGDIVISIIR